MKRLFLKRRVLETLIVSQLLKKNSFNLWNQKFHCHVNNSLPVLPVKIQIVLAQNLTFCVFKVYYKVVIPFTFGFASDFPHFVFHIQAPCLLFESKYISYNSEIY